jgi:hypothetical protein
MEPVHRVGRGFSPLDKEWELGGSDLTPHAQEGLVRLATWVPFGRATQLLPALLGVQVSNASARRFTLQTGEAVLQKQDMEADHIKHDLPEAPPGAEKQGMSADGAMVPLVGGVWAEVKTLVLGAVKTTKAGEPQMQDLSSCSRLTDVPGFEKATLVETHRRGLEHATLGAAVMDGAEWLQGVIDSHRADAVRIRDFPHAAEYGSAIGEAVRQAGYHVPKNWLQGVVHRLKHEGPDRVLLHLSRLGQRCTDPTIGKKLPYVSQRVSQMQDPTYQAAGWPIGSGMVERANKLLVEARLKGAGMHGKRENVNPMLTLRDAVCNDRWDETWQKSRKQQQQQEQERKEHTQAHMEHARTRLLLLFLRCSPPRPLENVIPSVVNQPIAVSAPAAPGPRRPAVNHPWRRPYLAKPNNAISAKPDSVGEWYFGYNMARFAEK